MLNYTNRSYEKLTLMKISVRILKLYLFLFTCLLSSCKKEDYAVLFTAPISNITSTSASGGGNIISDGGARVSSRGICWSPYLNPTIFDSKTIDGNGTGQYISVLYGLTPGSVYHVRAYATNSAGTSYGSDLAFETTGNAPNTVTQDATNVSASGATLNGIVNANDLSSVVTFEFGVTLDYGQTFSAIPNNAAGDSLTKVFAVLSGLSPGTSYHFRVIATNSLGTSFGIDKTFNTTEAGINGTMEIAFQPGSDYNQMAVWLEDPDGKYIETVFLTDFIGRNGGGNRTSDPNIDISDGNRLSALPVWSFKRGVIDKTFGIDNYYPPAESRYSYPKDIDAISGATPGRRIQKISWPLQDFAPGKFNCWIEVNRSYDFNQYHNYSFYRGQPSLVWNTLINLGGSPDSSKVLTFTGYGSPDGSDGKINGPDSTITTAPGLLYDLGGYKFKVIFIPD